LAEMRPVLSEYERLLAVNRSGDVGGLIA
jgi:hypothetical protein